MANKTDPSISISFPRAKKDEYIGKRNDLVRVFEQHGISGFSAAVRQFLDGETQEIDGKKVWVVSMDV